MEFTVNSGFEEAERSQSRRINFDTGQLSEIENSGTQDYLAKIDLPGETITVRRGDVALSELQRVVALAKSIDIGPSLSGKWPRDLCESTPAVLRAWTLALLASVAKPQGPAAFTGVPASSIFAEQEIQAPEVQPVGTAAGPDPDSDELARQALRSVKDIRAAAATVDGASAIAVESFIQDALGPIRDIYARGGEARQGISDALILFGARWDFPWKQIQGESGSLAILYNFSPFQDTGSTVASKRLRDFSETFDVISCSFLQHKKQDPTIELISMPYVARKEFLELTPSWASWPAHRAFAERAMATAQEWMDQGKTYRHLYTRAMWVPALYAGVGTKLAHPQMYWTAEFSDPLSLDVEGHPRGGGIPQDAFIEPLVSRWQEDYSELSEEDLSIFRFAELLAYGYADSVIFTNEQQRDIMIGTIDNAKLRDRVLQISTVSHHPTLAKRFYDIENVDYHVDPEYVNLGYFGEFYSSRGITEITDALRSLPDEVRSRVRLHVFTNYIPESAGGKRPSSFSAKQFKLLVQRTLDGVGVEGVEENVIFNNSLPYLRFLAVTQYFDYLIVTDAKSGLGHEINPYLPSKWSDYRGSRAKVWALTEQGSVLSRMNPDVQSPVGDRYAAREVMWQMVEEKFGEQPSKDMVLDMESF